MIATYVINLDSSPGRWEKCLAQLQGQPVALERIAAVDGRKLNSAEIGRHYSPLLNQTAYHKRLNAGEIGCYLSHRKAWQQLLASSHDWALILEDDFVCQGNLNILPDIVRQVADDWDYIKLADKGERRHALYTFSLHEAALVVYQKIPARTCAQLVSRRGAQKLLQHSESFGRPVDIDIQHWWEKDLTVYGLQPYPFVPDYAESEIDSIANRHKRAANWLTKIQNQWYFLRANRTALKQRWQSVQTIAKKR